MKITISALLILFVVSFNSLTSQIIYQPPEKKLIDFSQHSPYIKYYKEHIRDYEKGPFDGITMKLSSETGGGNIFMVDNWTKVTAAGKDSERKLAETVETSSVLTDNFLVLFGASQMDWFSDSDWAKAEDYIRYAARIAKTAHCKGILWDAEPYRPGKNPWKYDEQELNNQHSFSEYYNQVRKRGAQFIKALQEEYPGLVVFSLRELSDWQKGSPFSTPLLPVMDKESTFNELKNAWWGLHVPFYVGILDAIEPNVTFIDGNEEAYYYTSPLEYYEVRSTLIDDAKALIPPELWSRHTSSFRLGHAIAPEYITGNWLGMKPFSYRLTGQGVMMTPEDKAKWLEHNTYYALRTSDRYAWTWAEDIDWWTGNNLPSGFIEALFSAKKKIYAVQPLGFEIDDMIKVAQGKAVEFYKNK
jgi:hypothetical protein